MSGDVHSNPFLEVLHGFMATGTMLSYYGSRREVCQMLQLLCHASRLYIVEQKSLPAFLVHKPSALGLLITLQNIGSLKEKYKLEKPERFLKKLTAMKKNEEREAYLKEHHTILFIKFLKATEGDDELQEFCKGLRDNCKLFTFYIEYYLLPWFESLRQENRLIKGNTAHFK